MAKRKFGIVLTTLAILAIMASSAFAAPVTTSADLKAAMAAGGEVVLGANIASDVGFTVPAGVSTVLNLNGKSITRTKTVAANGASAVLFVSGGTLVVKDTAGGGSIVGDYSGAGTGIGIYVNSSGDLTFAGGDLIVGGASDDHAIRIDGNVAADNTSPYNSKVTVTGGTVGDATKTITGIVVFGNGAELTVKDGTIQGHDFGISGNGSKGFGGTSITVSGGTVKSTTVGTDNATCGAGIYHPQAGKLVITGGTITGDDGVQMKAGNLTMSAGTVAGTGTYPTPAPKVGSSILTGAALSLWSQAYPGAGMTVQLSETATLTSSNGYAIYESYPDSGSSELSSFAISGGTYTGSKGAAYMKGISSISKNVTGGTFSSDPSALVSSPYVAKYTNGVYVVNLAAVTVSPDSCDLVLGISPTMTLVGSSDVSEGFTWETGDANVATVDASTGKVTAVAAGNVTITAKGSLSGSTGACTVRVRSANNITLSNNSATLSLDSTLSVTASHDAAESVTWSTSNVKVATVSDGLITAVGNGVATITATGTSSGYQAGIVIKVTSDNTDIVPVSTTVEPGALSKANNPVATESNVPSNVEAEETTTYQSTAATRETIITLTGIPANKLGATETGEVTVNGEMVYSAIKTIMTSDSSFKPTYSVLTPMIGASVTSGKVAAMAFTLTGSQLNVSASTLVKDIKLIKIKADGTGELFKYASAPAAYADKYFTIKDVDGKTLSESTALSSGGVYTIIVFVKDNGDFDLDKTDGHVVDPMAITVSVTSSDTTTTSSDTGTTTTSGDSASPDVNDGGAGCNAGFAALALLMAIPVVMARRKQ